MNNPQSWAFKRFGIMGQHLFDYFKKKTKITFHSQNFWSKIKLKCISALYLEFGSGSQAPTHQPSPSQSPAKKRKNKPQAREANAIKKSQN